MEGKESNKQVIDMSCVRDIVSKFADRDDPNLISVLQQAQDEYGYLPKSVLKEISSVMDIPLTRIFGVVTFYSQFTLTPRGRHSIKVCSGTACHVKGAEGVKQKLRDELQINEGETTPDYQFTLETVACIGTCFLAPVMMVDERYYGKLTADKTSDIVGTYSNKKLGSE
ncbi:MAG: NADH-quinone oxidoreductase subunit NuoE [Candidatus Scalindua sp.]|nr:NADH-quinone oxidoreductase subunit NuoE [Candidatus Scalindua sp.]